MKKIIFLLVAVLGLFTATMAQEWATYDVPAEVSAVTVSPSAVYVFGTANYWQAALPLPENPDDISWMAGDLPLSDGVVTQAGFVEEELFILMGDRLFKKTDSDWHYEFDGVTGMSADGRRLFVWFDATINIYTGSQWILDYAGDEILALAFQGDNILTFSPDRTLYLNASYWQEFEDFSAAEIAFNGDYYTAVGEVIGGYAAFYSSNVNQSFKYIHVLSPGQLTSAANLLDGQYVAGNLNGQGVIFDPANMADIKVTETPVNQIRSNGNIIAAIESNALHVRGQHVTTVASVSAKENHLVIVNPVVNSVWQVFSEEESTLQIVNLLGQTVSQQELQQGANRFNLDLKPGVYLAGGKKVVVQ
jgi:hypothetical protein